MSELQTGQNRLLRRPSFWKTPITRNALQTIGKKRNFSQLHQDKKDNPNQVSITNPNKKRRVLSNREIESIAKCGGFHPSNILIAVQESDGFCWFKRVQKSCSTQDIQQNKQKYLQKYANLDTSNMNQSSLVFLFFSTFTNPAIFRFISLYRQ